jgi:hypothetical protein
MIKITVTTVSKQFPQLGPSTWDHTLLPQDVAWYLSGVLKAGDILNLEIERVAS